MRIRPLAILLLLVTGACAEAQVSGRDAAFPAFEYHVIDHIGSRLGQTALEHVVANQPCHEPEAADVNGDGDVDVAAKPWSTGDEHYYLRNLTVEQR